jgi:hypothetical protein
MSVTLVFIMTIGVFDALLGFAAAEPAERRINAVSFGVTCDGKSDNAVALENIRSKLMIDGGQTVFFPSSEMPCLSSRPISAVSGTTYKADAGGVTFKRLNDSSANTMLFSASGVSNVLVQGLHFDGGVEAGGATPSIVTVYKSSNVVFDGVTVENVADAGIVFSTNVKASGLRKSRIINVGNRWKATGSKADQHQGVIFCCGTGNSKNFVIDSSFENTGLDAISFSQQTGFVASGNHFLNVGGGQAGILGARLDVGVVNHGLWGGAAIYGAESTNTLIKNNVTDGAGGNGIDLYRAGGAKITGNTVRRSGGNGIAFGEACNAVIADNVSVDNNQARASVVSAPQAGIFLTGGRLGHPTVCNIKISRNHVTDTQTTKTQNYAIQIQDGSTYSDIRIDGSNQLLGNAVAAFGESIASHKADKSTSR